jgi:type II secretory pathway component PulM
MSFPSDALKNLKKESAQDSMSHVPFSWGTVDESKSNLTLEIDPLIFYKIMHWIDKEDYEVSGLGMIEVDHDRNVMRVVDAILLQQENTSATTEIDGHAIGRAMHEFRQRQTPGMLKWWWHSHVNMNVFWSGTDQAAIKCLGGGDTDNASWFVATVFNQRREMLSAYVQNRPIKLVQTGIETKVRQRLDQSVVDQWDAEYDEKVELPSSRGSFLFSGNDDEGRFELFRQWRERQEQKLQDQLAEAEEVEADAEEVEEEEVDLAEALEEGHISMDDLFKMHDEGIITDDELDELYAGSDSATEIDEMDLVELMEQEDKAMDIGPVRKKSLREIG